MNLKPCPFCGSEPILRRCTTMAAVSCPKCLGMGPVVAVFSGATDKEKFDLEESAKTQAAEAWNNRSV